VSTIFSGQLAPTKEEIERKNRHLYDEAFGPTFRRVVLDPLHDGRDFINMGGAPLIDRLARLGGSGPGTAVLGLCSGPGGVACYLADAYGCTVTGVELNACQFGLARSGLDRLPREIAQRVRFVHSDILHWVPDRFYDAAISVDSVMLIDDVDGALRMARAAVRQGGVLLVATITAGAMCREPTRARAWEEDGVVTLIPAAEYLDRLAGAGFAPARSLDLSEDAWTCCTRILKAVESSRELIVAAEDEATYEDWVASSRFYVEAFEAAELEYHAFVAGRP